jgi:hypothetical protein
MIGTTQSDTDVSTEENVNENTNDVKVPRNLSGQVLMYICV